MERLLGELDDDPRVSGILLQLPTPPQIDGGALTECIDPAKDVDGLTPISAGLLAKGRPGLRPCTPLGVMELLRRHDVALEGAEAVVVGRSDLVGKPVASLLLAANATVTICHSRTRDLAEVCRRADVLIAAVGVPGLVHGDWVKEGAVVIDVGINRTDEGLTGDVDFEPAAERARLITPVPGGVGPMTIAMLLRNTLRRRAPRPGSRRGPEAPARRRVARRRPAASRCSSRCSCRGTRRTAATSRATRRSPSSTSCSCCVAALAIALRGAAGHAGRSGAARRVGILTVVVGHARHAARRCSG